MLRLAAPVLMLAACAPRTPASLPAVPDPVLDRVVATFEERPVRMREVLQTAAESDFEGLLRRHLAKLALENRREELDVRNTDEERLARARLAVAAKRGEAGFAELVRRSGLSEEQYIRSYAKSPELDARLAAEKVVIHALLSSESAEVDLAGFERREAAELYRERLVMGAARASCKSCEKAPCPAHALPTPAVRVENLRLVRGSLSEDLGESAEKAVFEASPGDLVGPVRERSGAWVVVQLIARQGPRSTDSLMDALLADPPDDLETRAYVDRLLRSLRIVVPR